MTTPESPPRLPTGTFIVRDSADERAISALLARHRVKGSPSAPAGGARARQELRAAEHRLHELEATYAQTQELLARAVADLEAERAARRALDDEKYSRLIEAEAELARERELHHAASQDAQARGNSVVGLEADLAHAGRRIDELTDELTKSRDAAAKPTPIAKATTAVREQDRASFSALADRLDREAVSKSKTIANVLRLAARAVRDEVAAVYDEGRAAS